MNFSLIKEEFWFSHSLLPHYCGRASEIPGDSRSWSFHARARLFSKSLCVEKTEKWESLLFTRATSNKVPFIPSQVGLMPHSWHFAFEWDTDLLSFSQNKPKVTKCFFLTPHASETLILLIVSLFRLKLRSRKQCDGILYASSSQSIRTVPCLKCSSKIDG